MWVWSPVSVTGSTSDNRAWDPTSSEPRNAQSRFFENYKGSQDLFFDFCENKSIRVLYFFNAVWEWDMASFNNSNPRIPHEAEFANFVAEAHRRGIQVWLMGYLWDNPNDSRMTQATHKQSIKRMAEAAHNFNLTYPETPIAGIHLDQEPSDTTVYDDLLDTMKIAQDWVDANAPTLLISQALRPKWRNQNITWNGATKPMNDHIMNTIGHGAYMSYNDDVSICKSWLTPIINHASSNNKKIASGFEVTDYHGLWANSDKETWWEEILSEPLSTRFKVDPTGPVTFEDAMHDIVDTYQAQSGYDRQVIHSYADYFEHWFGQRPRDYILSLPNGEYNSALQNPAKANLFQDTRELVGINPFPATIASTPTLDSDSNMLNDAWEIQHFGRTGSVAIDADTDGDGYTTFEEMVFGLNPNAKDSAPTNIQVVKNAGTQKLAFTFCRPSNFENLNVTYQLEKSSSLNSSSWTPDSTTGTISDDGTTQWITFLLPLDQPNVFYRCKVTPNL